MRRSANRELSNTVRESLTRLCEDGDRSAPVVFAGRGQEFALLAAAANAAGRRQPGQTVVVQGVPGSGKTALLNEHVARLFANTDSPGHTTLAVPLRPADLDAPPAALVHVMDRRLRMMESSASWARRIDRAAALAGKTAFSMVTKKDVKDFVPSATAPDSLFAVFDDYISFRFKRSPITILLMVVEAQNCRDTAHVRAHLDALHNGLSNSEGTANVMLACFGLTTTVGRLGELGLSRLANGHVRTICTLDDDAARGVVTGTLQACFQDHAFHEGNASCEAARGQWIGTAANAILKESANFPHHIANACRALAEIVLADGVGDAPPIEQLRERCRQHRREYYDARLQPWANHTTALALAFGTMRDGWVRTADLKRALTTADNDGDPVDADAAAAVIHELRRFGYLESKAGACRAALPSLLDHFDAIRRECGTENEVSDRIRDALAGSARGATLLHAP